MTARHKVALISILHLNKKTDLKPTQRVGGAGSIANVSRCVWMFSQDPEDKDEYYMAKGKGNLIPRGVKGLKYTTIETPMTFSKGKLGTTFKVDWLGEHEMNADEVSRMEKDVDKCGNSPTMTDQMKLWLREELEKGPRLATEMYDSGDIRFGDGKPKGDEGKKDIGKTLKRAQLAIGGADDQAQTFLLVPAGVWTKSRRRTSGDGRRANPGARCALRPRHHLCATDTMSGCLDVWKR